MCMKSSTGEDPDSLHIGTMMALFHGNMTASVALVQVVAVDPPRLKSQGLPKHWALAMSFCTPSLLAFMNNSIMDFCVI